MPDQPKPKSKKESRRLAGIIAVLILINIAAYFFYTRFDLTSDKRYTITPATKTMLHHLPEKVDVLVFLKGEQLPAAFKRLAKSTEELLRSFQSISDNKISFQVLDPLGDDTTVLQTLAKYRMSGIPVTVDAGKKGTTQKMIFPWALVISREDNGMQKALPVFLQESNTPELSRSILNKSEILLEYNLANAIHQVTQKKKRTIAYLTGNDEAFGLDIIAAFSTLEKFYILDTFNLQASKQIPDRYDALIINRPMKAFSEVDKFKIDQYLMQGRPVFWNIDAVSGSLDSFNRAGTFNAMPLDLNLNDMLFQYGLRVNGNLIEDAVSCAGIPLTASANNAQPVIYPWVYFPVLQSGSDHPIVRNLNGVLGRFVSTIDFNSNDPAIKKTVLLTSSDYSKTAPTPTPIILESAMVQKDPATFRDKNLIAAALLEGVFSSVFSERQPKEVLAFIDSAKVPFLKKAKEPTKMIVAADGEIMMNEVSQREGPLDMGVYRFSDYRFDNKSFLLNCMEYLTDPENLLAARNKTYQTRLLDPDRLKTERTFWQFINIGIPVVLILILGAVYFFIRKKKYG